jgi:hypothetical protein
LTLVGVVIAARVEDQPEPVARRAGRSQQSPAGIERAPRAAGVARAAPLEGDAAPRAIGFERLPRPRFDAAVVDGVARAWEPAPPPPPPKAAFAARPARPAAPPLPFVVIGRFNDGVANAAIVQSGPAVHVMRPGDVIERDYRVEAVNEKEVTLMYLPLQIKQTLDLGARP